MLFERVRPSPMGRYAISLDPSVTEPRTSLTPIPMAGTHFVRARAIIRSWARASLASKPRPKSSKSTTVRKSRETFSFPARSVRYECSGESVPANKIDGPPIAGAIVVAEPIGDRIPPVHGLADAAGRFQLYRPFEKAVVYARDSAGDLAGFVTVAEDDDDEISILAGPAAVARGRIVDAAGEPLKATLLRMRSCSKSTSSKTRRKTSSSSSIR